MAYSVKKLKGAVLDLSSIEDVKAIMLFGSYTSLTRPKDIDLLIVLDSNPFNKFTTKHESYNLISKALMDNPTFPKIDPVIKSMDEFECRNVVSLSKGFLQHLVNVGVMMYGDNSGLAQKIRDRYEENKIVRGYWNELGDSFSIRKSCINKEMNEGYNLPLRFYHQAVREVFGLEFPGEFDNRNDIIDLFYSELFERKDNFFDVSPEFVVYKVKESLKYENPFTLKDEIERAMFAMNSILKDI